MAAAGRDVGVGEEHLVADGLDDPSPVRRHDVAGEHLEALDELGHLLLAHPARRGP